jgi:pimeloyl-ACP methyl ester carboxylesterase
MFADDKLVMVNTGSASDYLPAGIDAVILRDKVDYDYFDLNGIDHAAHAVLDALKAKGGTILAGHSLGGTIVRRAAQLAKEEGVPVKGYITSSAPLTGNRLCDREWALTASAALACYLLAVDTTTYSTALISSFSNALRSGTVQAASAVDEDATMGASPEAKAFFENLSVIRSLGKRLKSTDDEATLREMGARAACAIVAPGENASTKGALFTYLGKAVWDTLLQKGTMRDLNPLSSFMADSNSAGALADEAGYRRAFLISANGNIFETGTWGSAFKHVINFYNVSIAASLAGAALSWWNPIGAAAALLRAATFAAGRALVLRFPNAWAYACSGSFNDLTGHDGFVQNNNVYKGKVLRQQSPDFSPNTRLDYSYYMTMVSHIDIADDYKTLCTKEGKSESKRSAADQFKGAYKQAVLYILQE